MRVFSPDLLQINPATETDRIARFLRDLVLATAKSMDSFMAGLQRLKGDSNQRMNNKKANPEVPLMNRQVQLGRPVIKMQAIRKLKSLRRRFFALRAFLPGLQRRHHLEAMVGPLGFWNELQEFHLSAVKKLGLLPTHTLLDLGCGPLQGGEVFIRYLGLQQYTGIDRSRSVINVAHEQIARNHLGGKNPQLFHSETFGDKELGMARFDFIWASQVLHYFDEPTMDRLFGMVSRRLNPAGIMAGDVLGPAADRSFLRHPLPPAHSAATLDAIARGHGLRVIERGILKDFGYPNRLGLHTNVLLEISHHTRVKSQDMCETF